MSVVLKFLPLFGFVVFFDCMLLTFVIILGTRPEMVNDHLQNLVTLAFERLSFGAPHTHICCPLVIMKVMYMGYMFNFNFTLPSYHVVQA